MKTIEKLMALTLALVICLSLGVCAFADETTFASATATITKAYDVVGGNETPSTVPTFTVTANTGNPATVKDVTAVAATNSNGSLALNADGTLNITFTFPGTDTAGVYTYTIAEDTMNVQGVVTDTSSIIVKVYCTYDENDRTKTSTTIEAGTLAVDSEGNELKDAEGKSYKVAEFTNTYKLGTLTVTKKISGNLAETDDVFAVTVTFNSTTTVASNITYSGGSNSEGEDLTGSSTIAESDWNYDAATGAGTASVTIYLKADQTVTFSNIPAGVTYTVTEANYTTGTMNTDNYGYSAAEYVVTDTDTTSTDPTTTTDKWSDNTENATRTSGGATGTIGENATDTVTITNEKKTEMSTGVSLESLPYVLVLAAVLALGAVLVIRKRRVED